MEFNSKQELEEYIRGRVRQLMGKTDSAAYQGNPESPMNLMLLNFPQLSDTLEKLLTNQYRIFVNDIQWVAPKPTTFKIVLPNGQFFNLIWNTEDFIVKVSGVQYDMLTLPDRERATKSISELLQYGPINANLSPEDLSRQNLVPAKGEPVSTPPTSEEKAELSETKVRDIEVGDKYDVLANVGKFSKGSIITVIKKDSRRGMGFRIDFKDKKGIKDFITIDNNDEIDNIRLI
jgi:hypothetical protein